MKNKTYIIILSICVCILIGIIVYFKLIIFLHIKKRNEENHAYTVGKQSNLGWLDAFLIIGQHIKFVNFANPNGFFLLQYH